MTTRPYKFLVTPVVQQLDADGDVIGERTIAGDQQGAPIILFGCSALAKWAEDFPATLADMVTEPTA